MAAIKASELVTILCDHIKEHGDEKILILDHYNVVYKTISKREISRNDNRFVIECLMEEDDLF